MPGAPSLLQAYTLHRTTSAATRTWPDYTATGAESMMNELVAVDPCGDGSEETQQTPS